jgi:hypothetical protein
MPTVEKYVAYTTEAVGAPADCTQFVVKMMAGESVEVARTSSKLSPRILPTRRNSVASATAIGFI